MICQIQLILICIGYKINFNFKVGRAGRFGTKGLAITFVSNSTDSEILNKVQERFEVNISELPEKIDNSSYSINIIIIFFQ